MGQEPQPEPEPQPQPIIKSLFQLARENIPL